jgi:hypothetical protein
MTCDGSVLGTPTEPPCSDLTSPLDPAHIASMVEQDLRQKIALQNRCSSEGAVRCSVPEASTLTR